MVENCRVNDCRKKELMADIERYRRGIAKIKEYLEEKEPRVGDATFDCEALLAE